MYFFDVCCFFFFFSSRRRHTRSDRDWSSDVCSSDLLTSEWHRPAAWMAMRTSPSCGSRTSMSSTETGAPTSWNTAPCDFIGPPCGCAWPSSARPAHVLELAVGREREPSAVAADAAHLEATEGCV